MFLFIDARLWRIRYSVDVRQSPALHVVCGTIPFRIDPPVLLQNTHEVGRETTPLL
jgi:hypothetical protein